MSHVLVILDDVWDVEIARDLCEAAPDDAHVLITTLSDEIKIARDTHGVRLGYLDAQEAVDLLKQYSLLRHANDGLLEGLGNALGGHPLALTLAARRAINEIENYSQADVTAILSKHIHQYNDQLPQSDIFANRVLERGQKRDENLEKSLAYSYQALPTELDKANFRALGILADAPVNLSLLSGLWDIPQDKVLEDGCLPLLKTSLLAKTDTENLYRIHPLLKNYARFILQQAGELDTAYKRLLDYFRRMYPYGENLKNTFQRLSGVATDFPHMSQVLTWGWTKEPRHTTELYFAIDLYLSLKEDPALRLKLNREAQDASEKCQYILGIANARLTQGRIHLFQHDLREALKAFRAAKSLYIDIGSEVGVAKARLGEADTHSSNFDVESALPIYQDLEEALPRLKWPEGEAHVLEGQARIHFIKKDFDQCANLFLKIQIVYRNLGLDFSLLIARLGEADARFNNSELETALAIYIDVQKQAREIDHRLGLAVALSREGQVRLKMSDLELALEKFRAAQKILTTLNASSELIHALKGEADALLKQPSIKASLRAEKLYTQIWEQYSQINHVVGQISTLQQLEKLALMRRDFLAASEYRDQAHKLNEGLPTKLEDETAVQSSVESLPLIRRQAPKLSPEKQETLSAVSQWIEKHYSNISFLDPYMTGCDFVAIDGTGRTIGFRIIVDQKYIDWGQHINFHVVSAYHDLDDYTYDMVGVICVAGNADIASMLTKKAKHINISSRIDFSIGIIQDLQGARSFLLLEKAKTNFPRQPKTHQDEE